MNGLPFTLSDEELVALAADGDDGAFELIVIRHRHALVRLCAGIVGPSDAEEAVQEALLRALIAIRGGEQVRRVGPWLRTIARNATLNLLRARTARPAIGDFRAPAGIPPGPDAYARREELRIVVDAVASLPDRQREALVMRELEGRSYAEIGDRLRTSSGAVRQLLVRARAAVRSRLGVVAGAGPFRALAGGGAAAGGGLPASVAGGCAVTIKVCTAVLLPTTLGSAALTGPPAPPPRARAQTPTRHAATALRPSGATPRSLSPDVAARTSRVYVTLSTHRVSTTTPSRDLAASSTSHARALRSATAGFVPSPTKAAEPAPRTRHPDLSSSTAESQEPSGARLTEAQCNPSHSKPGSASAVGAPSSTGADDSASGAANESTPDGGPSSTPRPAETDAAPAAASVSGSP